MRSEFRNIFCYLNHKLVIDQQTSHPTIFEDINQYRDFRGIHICGIVYHICSIVYHICGNFDPQMWYIIPHMWYTQFFFFDFDNFSKTISDGNFKKILFDS